MDEKLMVIVTVDEQYLEQIQRVSEQLQGKGMQVDAVMQMVGMISGAVSADQFEELNQVEGVARVEIQREYTAT